MIALIDADSIAYKIGYTHQDVDVDRYGVVVDAVDNYISHILRSVNATQYHGFLGTNHQPVFRHQIDPDYKGNRNKAKPEWMDKWGMVIKNRMVYKWKFLVVMGIEAEDGVSIYASQYRKDGTKHCICSVDKDLQQIPGKHYNYEKEVWTDVSEIEALTNLWIQVLTGDPTDNIKGIYGMGPKTAQKVLKPAGPKTMMHRTLDTYIEKMGEHAGIYEFAKTYGLVKLLEEQPDSFEIVSPHRFIEALI